MTFRMNAVFLMMGFLVCLNAFGQEATPAAPAAPAPAAGAAAGAAEAAPAPAETTPPVPVPAPAPAAKKAVAQTGGGDVIVLKSGKVLKDLKITGRTPTDITVRIISGVTISIPRKQIESIRENVPDSTPGATEDTASSKNDLSPEVLGKLAAPLPDPPLKYDNKDIVLILEDLSKKTGVTFIVDDSVRSISQKDRSITFEAKSGMNAMNLLQDEVLKKVKKLDVIFQGDKLLFVSKDRSTMPAVPPATPPATPGTPAAPGATPAAGTPPPPPPAAADTAGTPPPARRRRI